MAGNTWLTVLRRTSSSSRPQFDPQSLQSFVAASYTRRKQRALSVKRSGGAQLASPAQIVPAVSYFGANPGRGNS